MDIIIIAIMKDKLPIVEQMKRSKWTTGICLCYIDPLELKEKEIYYVVDPKSRQGEKNEEAWSSGSVPRGTLH